MERLLDALLQQKIDVRADCALASYTSFRVGGSAAVAAFPSTREQLVKSLSLARDRGVRCVVLGNASNVVISDSGYDGLVIFTGGCRQLWQDSGVLYADCGASLTRVAAVALDASLGGAEFLHGIPGTVGGAVFMNAGAFGGCMADICVRTEYWDAKTGEIGAFVGAEHLFGTRTSVYAAHSPRYVVLGAELALSSDDAALIRARMNDFLSRRKSTQPLEYPSAGSVFKRPVGHYAGKLIEDCGLKGLTVGGAQVSKKHAGFIINVGGATAEDIMELTRTVQKTVLEQTGVALEPEIRFIDSKGE